MLPRPLRALACKGSLVDVVRKHELEPRAGHADLPRAVLDLPLARLLLGLHALEERWLVKDEAEFPDLREFLFEFTVGEDGKVGGDDG
jgi:hypothetical protein